MKLHTVILVALIILSSTSVQSQCNTNSNHHAQKTSWHDRDNLIDVVSDNDNFGTLSVAVKTAGLASTLESEGPFTVFAPTNNAFAKLPDGTVESLLKPESRNQLKNILSYHVVQGEFLARDVINAIKSSNGKFEIETVNGGILTASLQGDTVILTDETGSRSAILQTDVKSSNGVAHVIDSVVLPK